jgi:hypothetical protein
VLDFFAREGWAFRASGGRWAGTGEVTGQCDDLVATASLRFEAHSLLRIELIVGEEWYVYSLPAGRPERLAHYDRKTGLPKRAVVPGADAKPHGGTRPAEMEVP